MAACNQAKESNNLQNQTVGDKQKAPEITDPSCATISKFGDEEICMPTIDGMTECLNHPLIQKRMKENKAPGNTELGFYVDNGTYQSFNNDSEVQFDSFFKVFGVDKISRNNLTTSELNILGEMMAGKYLAKNWDKIKKDFDEIKDSITIGKPILLDKYSPDSNIRSAVFLTKVRSGKNDIIQIMVINMVLVKKKIFTYSYYKDYAGMESLEKVKATSDYFGLRLVDENK